MVDRKDTAMCIWIHNSPILAHMQLLPSKGKSLIVEQLFGVQIAHIRCIVLSYAQVKRRKKKEEEERRAKPKFSCFLF